MDEAIIIINAEDVPAAEQLAESLAQYCVYIFDPVLVDRLASSRLKVFELITWDDAPSYASLHKNAEASADALEREIDASRAIFFSETSIRGWQFLSLYYLFISLHWYAGLWQAIGHRFSGKKLHVFICENPSSYYFNSFIPSLTLLEFARHKGLEFAGYSYGAKEDVSHKLPDLRGQFSGTSREFLLTHLPTCMYDLQYFNEELRACGKFVVDLEAHHFSMPVHADTRIGLSSTLDPEKVVDDRVVHRIDAFMDSVGRRIHEVLERHIATPAFRDRQVTQILSACRSQLCSYFLLGSYFDTAKPSMILLSDHDTGLHGPLISFAERHGIPVRVLPHCKTAPDLEFAYANLSVLCHPTQGEHVLDRTGRSVPCFKLAFPTNFHGTSGYPAPPMRIGLLLNAFSLNGIFYANYPAYIAGIRRIADYCRQQGLHLRVRGKPSYTLIQLLSKEAGLDIEDMIECVRMTMSEFVGSCDVCLMYDTPTSAAIEFLSGSVPILNPVLAPLTRQQASFTDSGTIARESVDEVLNRVSTFRSDPGVLHQFRLSQFRRYLDLFADVRPLRVFL